MIIGVPKETHAGERRVALVPDAVKQIAGDDVEVHVERGAGVAAGFPDRQYEAAGAVLVPDFQTLASAADAILRVQPPTDAEVGAMRQGQVLIGFLEPLDRTDLAQRLAKQGVTAFAMELMPRITRAQSMDALSSQSTISGYRAVLLAATRLPKIFPMLVTAAGTLSPAKVLVVGAGVAGLQAIGTAKRLGAVVEAYDTRAAVREQVESLGARFVELDLDTGDAEDAGGYARAQSEEFYARQREQLGARAATCDVVITTALVPGQTAPRLIDEAAVRGMRPGSVIVDLAAAKGGNCACTQADREVEVEGVLVLGHTNLPAEVPAHASQMYAKNLVTFLKHLISEGRIAIDLEDEITRGALLTHSGEIASETVRSRLGGGA